MSDVAAKLAAGAFAVKLISEILITAIAVWLVLLAKYFGFTHQGARLTASRLQIVQPDQHGYAASPADLTVFSILTWSVGELIIRAMT